jgi:uncharacterized protein HemY
MTDRIEAIRRMLRKEPDDVFLHYSLGMEYASAGRHDAAVGEFRRCIDLDAGYVAGYVEAGKSLRAMGDLPGARDVFACGLAAAEARGERHSQDFIRQQLQSLPQ